MVAEANIASKSKALRIIAIIVAVVVFGIILLSVVIFPRMENLFLRKGLEYAKQKTMAVLPAIDGYNPDLHPYDPLIIDVALSELQTSLDLDTMASEVLVANTRDFMQVFRRQYDDQLLTPEEIKTIAESLDTLQRTFLRKHFNPVKINVLRLIEAKSPELSDDMFKVLGFDSVAIFNPEVKLGLTGPYTVKLINEYYKARQDGDIGEAEYDEMLKTVKNLDQFQLRDELRATSQAVYKTEEFEQFEKSEKFRENITFILDRLRDTEYNFEPVKSTLRSFVYIWYQKAGRETDSLKFDVASMFEMTQYAAGHAKQTQTSDK